MYSTDRPVSAEMRKLHYTCCIINRVETVMPLSTLPRASVRYQAKNTLRSPAIKRHGGRICLTAFMQPVKRSRLPCLFCFLYLFVCISLFLCLFVFVSLCFLYLFVFCVSFVSVSLLICFVFPCELLNSLCTSPRLQGICISHPYVRKLSGTTRRMAGQA